MRKTILGIAVLIVASVLTAWLTARPLCPETRTRSTPLDWKRASTCQEARALLAASTRSAANANCARTGDFVATFRLVVTGQGLAPDGTCMVDGRGTFKCGNDLEPCLIGPLDPFP